jgi:hypothetical protein
VDGDYSVTYVSGTLTVTAIPPVISSIVVAPTANPPVITCRVTDSYGVTSLTMSVDGTALLVGGPYGTKYAGNYNGLLGALAGGSHTYVVTATNAYGATATATGTFTTTAPASKGPTISNIVVATSANPPVITWRLTDTAGIKVSTITVDGTYLPVYGPYGTIYAGNYSGVMGTMSAGKHTYVITATDTKSVSSKATGTFTVGLPLMVSAAGPMQPAAAALTDTQLAPIVVEAKLRLLAALGTHATAGLAGVSVQLADLPSGMLGEEVGTTIYIDCDAAGCGWFVDPTPADDNEFATSVGRHT